MDATSGQQPEPTQRRSAFGISWLVWIAFFLLVVYPLSTGPVFKLAFAGLLPTEVINAYAPLDALCEHSPRLQQFFRWYVFEIWRVKPIFP